MRAIKTLVTFMGVLLILGLGLLGYGMYSKATTGSKTPVIASPAGAPVMPALSHGPVASFGDVLLSEPAGSEITSAQVNGPLLVLQVRGGGKADRVILFDLASGVVLGRVGIGAPAAQ